MDNAIVRLNIDKNIIKRATVFKTPTDYNAWALKIKEVGKNWGYKDQKETDDVCYFYPGFDYKEFIEHHEQYWEALHDKLDALVKILQTISKYVNKNQSASQSIGIREIKGESNLNADIFISYPWANSNSIDEICRVLDHAGLKYKRDIKDCGYSRILGSLNVRLGKEPKCWHILMKTT